MATPARPATTATPTCVPTGFASDGNSCGSATDSYCDNGNVCNGAESCLSGVKVDGTNVGSGTSCGVTTGGYCDNPDTCDGQGTCRNNWEPNGAKADGNVCNGAESCLNGVKFDGTHHGDAVFPLHEQALAAVPSLIGWDTSTSQTRVLPPRRCSRPVASNMASAPMASSSCATRAVRW